MNTSRSLAIFPILFVLAACGGSEDSEPAADIDPADVEVDAALSAPGVVEATPQGTPAVLTIDQFGVDTAKIVFEHTGTEPGQSTFWIENFGERVAIETDLTTGFGPNRSHAYWDGDRLYRLDLETGERFDTPLRQRNMEPASVTVVPAADLESVGYERIGEMVIAGIACAHWRNPAIGYETCFWNRIELLSINGLLEDGGFTLRYEAIEIVVGEPIPDEIRALAP